nr:uncharacterized protein I303_00581 [Kwoniella dejecticola CBS 10117]OBR88764.1 hypothetical protein I303_00581 [Kwoniella dejecticola CBS 10117]
MEQFVLQAHRLAQAQAQSSAQAGTSINPNLLQPQRQQGPIPIQPMAQVSPSRPPTIDLTLSDSPPTVQNGLSSRSDQQDRINSPIQLIPPGSRRTPDIVPHRQLAVQPAPGRKRPLVPLIQEGASSSSAAKNVKSSSSSIDPPVKSENGALPTDPGAKSAPVSSEKEEPSMRNVRAFLTAESFKIHKPMELLKFLRKREKNKQTVPPLVTPNPKQVLEIVTAIRDHASDAYLKKMAEDDRYCEVWGLWLFRASKEIERWEPTIVPIFQVLAKTDMPYINYDDARLKSRSRKAVEAAMIKDVDSKNAIQEAYQRYQVWVNNVILPKAKHELSDDDDDDSNNKKRRVENAVKNENETSNPKAGPSRIPAPNSNGNTAINGVKTTAKPSAGPVSGSFKGPSSSAGKSAADMSFFGSSTSGASSSTAAKGKGKLPEFKKKAASTPAMPAQAPPAAGGSLLSRTMQSFKAAPPPSTSAAKEASSATAAAGAQSPIEQVKKEEAKPRYTAKGRLIRNVRFKDDVKSEEGGGALVQVKEFTQEAKEFERMEWQDEDDDIHGHSAHDLDMAEGAALASAHGHATIEWYDPPPYTDESGVVDTPEAQVQTLREAGSLAIQYPPGFPVPDPSESDVVIVQGDTSTRTMDPVDASQEILEYQSRGQYKSPSSGLAGILPPSQQGSIGSLLDNLKGITLPGQQHQQQQHQHQNQYGSYGYTQQAQPPSYPGGWGGGYGTHTNSNPNERQWGNGNGNTNGNYDNPQNNYQRMYDTYDNNNGGRELRPVDRDPSAPICRFWPRGE